MSCSGYYVSFSATGVEGREGGRDTDDSLLVADDVVRPGMSPVVPDSWLWFVEVQVPPVRTPVHWVYSDCSDFVERTVIRGC